MKKAGKKILASLLALLLIFSLAACGGNPSKNGDGEVIFNVAISGGYDTLNFFTTDSMMVYVERTKSIGAKKWYIMMKHILPNVFPLVFSEAILIVSSSILTETSLAFLGLGDPTNPSWGTMLNDAYSTGAMTVGAWWYFITPGLCVILVALGFTLMGYAFDEILNPKLKER